MYEVSNPRQEDVVSQDIKFYFAAASRPLRWCAGLMLGFYLLSSISFLDWSPVSLSLIGYLIIIGGVVFISYRVARVKQGEARHAATASLFLALILGLGHALLQLIWFWSWWRLLDLFLEPLAAALVGLCIGIIMTKSIHLIHYSRAAESVSSADDPPESSDNNPYGDE